MVMALEQLLWSSGDSVQLVLLHRICVPDEVLIWLVEILRPVRKSLMLAAVLYVVNTCTSGSASQSCPTPQVFSPKRSADLSQPRSLAGRAVRPAETGARHGTMGGGFGVTTSVGKGGEEQAICQNKHGWCGFEKTGAPSSREQSLLEWFLKMV